MKKAPRPTAGAFCISTALTATPHPPPCGGTFPQRGKAFQPVQFCWPKRFLTTSATVRQHGLMGDWHLFRGTAPKHKNSPRIPMGIRGLSKFYSIFFKGGTAVVGKSGRREIFRQGKMRLRRHTLCMARSHTAALAQKIRRAPQSHGRRVAPIAGYGAEPRRSLTPS